VGKDVTEDESGADDSKVNGLENGNFAFSSRLCCAGL